LNRRFAKRVERALDLVDVAPPGTVLKLTGTDGGLSSTSVPIPKFA